MRHFETMKSPNTSKMFSHLQYASDSRRNTQIVQRPAALPVPRSFNKSQNTEDIAEAENQGFKLPRPSVRRDTVII